MSVNDTRVVEMQFQNRKFERNISKSQQSLERFKKELNFDDTSKGLHNFTKSMESIDFSKLSDNIQKLTDKFTGFGHVGEFIISRIRRELEGLADRAIMFSKSLTFGQLDEGKVKFEKMNMSIRTIMAATGKTEEQVGEVMERLNTYTDQTSYNFADMAQNIGKFTSVGIPLEQAEKQMEGIANWAARSGAGINEASRAMYNLSQAMGVGALKLMDWKSIENAGMATKEFKEQMIAAGVAAGNLERIVKIDANGIEQVTYRTSKKFGKQMEVNFQNFSQTLSKGWADTTVIGNTLMGYYYDDLMYENEAKMIELTNEQKDMFNKMVTETGKIDQKAWKEIEKSNLGGDDLKQQLLDVAEAHGTLTAEVREDGKKIYTALDATGKKIEFTFDEFEKGLTGTWLTKNVANAVYNFDELARSSYQAAQKCTTFSDVLGAWKDMISTGWMATMQHIFGGLSDSINLFSAMCDKVSENILGIFGKGGTIENVFERWDQANGRDSLWGVIIGETATPEGDELYKGAYGLLDILGDIKEMISEAFWDIMKTFAEGYYDDSELAGWEDEESLQFRLQFIAFRIRDFTDSVQDFIHKVKAFFSEIPEGMSKSRWEMIKDVVQAVFHTISFAASVIGGIFHFFSRIRQQLQPSIDAIADLFHALAGSIIDTETDLRKGKGITTFFEKLADFLKPVTAIINKVVAGMTGMLKNFIKWGKESGFFVDAWKKIKDAIKGIWDFIISVGKPIGDFIGGLFHTIKDLFANGFDEDSVRDFKEKVKSMFLTMWEGIKAALAPTVHAIGDFFKNVWTAASKAITNYFSDEKTIGYKIVNWVRNAFANLQKGLNKIIPGATDSIGKFFKNIGDAIADLFNGKTDLLGSVKGIWAKVSDSITKFFNDGIGAAIKNVWDSIRSFFVRIFDPNSNGVVDTLKAIGDGLRRIGEAISNTVNTAITGTDSVGSALLKALGLIYGFFKKLTPEQWVLIAQIALAIAALVMVAKFLKQVFAAIHDIRVIVTSSKVEEVVKPFQSFAGKMLMLGAAIALVAFSIKIIGEMKVEDLGKGVASIAVVLAIMGLFIKLMKNTFHGNKDKGIEALTGKDVLKMVVAMIGISIAVNKVVKAMAPISTYSDEELKRMGISLAVVCAALIGVAGVAGKAKFDWKAGLGFVLFAASIGLLLKTLSGILKYRDAAGNIDWQAIAMMAGTLVATSIVLGILAKKAANNKGILYLAALSLAIGILVKSLTTVANMDWGQFGHMMAMLGGILVELLGFIWVFSKIRAATLDNSGLIQLVALAAGIYLLIQALIPIASMSVGEVGKMLLTFGGIILGLVGLIWAVNQFEGEMDRNGNNVRGLKKSGLGNIVFLALGIAGVILALKQVATIGGPGEWDGIIKMMAVYAVIVGGIVALVAVINKTSSAETGRGLKKTGMLLGLVAIVAGMALIIEVLKPLAKYTESELLKMMLPFVAIVLGMSLLIAACANMTKMSGDGSKIGKSGGQALLAMVGIILIMQTIIYMLKKAQEMDNEKMIIVFGGLSAVLISMSLVMSQLSKFGKLKSIGSKLVVLAAVVVAVGVLMQIFAKTVGKVKDVDADKMMGFGVAIVALSAAVAVLALVFPILGKMGGGAIVKGALALVAIGTALGAVIDILAGFAKSAIEKMSSALATMGTALRWFDEDMALVDSDRVRAGMNLVKELCESAIYVIGKGDLSDGLNNFAVAMSRLGIGLKRYWTNISGINVNSARIASEDFVIMSDNLNKLKTCENAADIIADLAGAIGIYCDTLNGKKIDDAPDAQKIKDTLIAISESVPENDIMKAVQEVAGDEGKVSLNKYAIGLENIATALHTFGEKSKDLDFSQISTAISKLQEISDLGPELETDFVKKFDIGGFIQFSTEIKGQKESLGTFSLDVEALGGALSDFGTKVGGITNWDQIDSGIQILDKFAGIQNKLPFVGGFITTITGAPDIQQFALKLPHVGDGLKGFCDKIQGASSLNNGEASTAAKVLEELGTASKSIGTNSGIFTFFASTDVEKFGEQLPGLGEGIAGFAGKIKGAVGPVTKDAVDNAVTVLTGICEAASKIPPNRGLKTLYEGINYTEFARQMPPLATGVVGFAENLRSMPTDVDSDKIRAASDVLVDICTAANMIPANEGIKTWLENINYEGFADDMGNLGTGVTNFLRAVHRVGNGNDLTLDPEVTSSLIRSKELLGYMIDVYNIIFDETGNVKLSKLRLGDNAGWFNRFGFELGGIFTNFLEGIKQFNSDYSAEESLSEAASKYELIKPIIEQITSLVSEYSSLKLAKVENTEPGSIIEGIATSLQSLLSFDSEIAWTDKHSGILDRVTSMFESLSSLQMMLVNYRSTMGTESGAAVFVSMLLDLADGLGVFAEQVNSYGFDNPNSAEYWSDTVEAAFVRIKEMMASIGSLGFLKEIVELQAIPTVFGQIITAYKDFITSTNALLVGGTSYAWTETQDNVLARVQQIVDVMSTIDDISTPNITPIVDFESVRDQINRWASEGVPGNLQIGANWLMTMKLDADQLTTIMPHDYTMQINSMNEKIGLMQQKLDNVYDRMNQFRVYMDTGTMVGVLAPRIDAYQGRDGFMAGRGVTITRR